MTLGTEVLSFFSGLDVFGVFGVLGVSCCEPNKYVIDSGVCGLNNSDSDSGSGDCGEYGIEVDFKMSDILE